MSLLPNTLLSAVAALALVLGLVLLAAKAARSTGFGLRSGSIRLAAQRRLTVREALALDRARRLLIVSCDGRDLLLLTGSNAETVVGWLPDAGQGARA